jgi:FlaA1/EpsC-like NDP-sugar epimerase
VATVSQWKEKCHQAATRVGNRRRRWYLFFLGGDVALIVAAMLSANAMVSGSGPSELLPGPLWLMVALVLLVKVPLLHWFGLYRMNWSYVSIQESVSIIRAVTLGSVVLAVCIVMTGFIINGEPTFPVKTLVADYLLTLVFLGSFRSARRLTREWFHPRNGHGHSLHRVLIVGAGDAGEQVARSLLMQASAKHDAVGFVDDDPAKLGTVLHGATVLGNRQEIPDLVRRLKVDQLWIAMPSCPGPVIRDTVELGRQAGLQDIRVVPSFGALLTGLVHLGDIRQVQLEDLLDRDPVQIDTRQIASILKGKQVLVTGAAGSIGAGLCRQIAQFEPERLVMLDQDESRLFDVHSQLATLYPDQDFKEIVGSVCDAPKINWVFQQFRPEVVFHAAAYKHVPLMESFPEEAIRTNVLGTWVVGKAALQWRARQFVLISTDKAVNPSSIMGATKRAAEVVIQDLNRAGETRFIAVRFGNVLGSRGSVALTFQKQIARGGPVTVTDPEMKRYFMSVEEAVLLVLQAAVIGEGGQVLVLDMGEPVKILELARHLIRLSGLEPDRDIPIVFTGVRPGEKLFEDLLTAEEGTSATCHERVFVARLGNSLEESGLKLCLERLEQALRENSREEMLAALKAIVPMHPAAAPLPALTGASLKPLEDALARPVVN